MLAPAGNTTLDYSRLFKLSIISKIDGSEAYADTVEVASRKNNETESKNSSRRLSGDEEWDLGSADGETEADRLTFGWTLTNHTAREVNFQLHFDHPDVVSSTSMGLDMAVFEL